MLGIADVYYNIGKIEKALKYFRLFKKSYRTSNHMSRVVFGIGKCLLKYKRNTEAIAQFESLLKKFKGSRYEVESHFYLGNLYAEEKKYYRALDHYQKIIRQKKEKRFLRDAYFTTGQLLFKINELKDAAKIYQEALAFAQDRQDSITAQAGYLNAMILNGKKKSVFKTKKSFLKAYPKEKDLHAGFLFYEGKYLYQLKEYKRSRKRLAEVLKRYPSSASASEALYYSALIQLQQNSLDQAIERFHRFKEKYPKHEFYLNARFEIATIYFNLQDYLNAAEEYRQVARLVKEKEKFGFKATYNAALAYERISVWDRAIEMNLLLLKNYKKFIKEEELLAKIGFCFSEDKKFLQALEHFERAYHISNEAERPEIKYWIATCYASLGKKEKALEEYLTISYKYKHMGKWGLTAEYEAARLYEKKQDFENAKMLYKKIIAADGENGDFGSSALTRLNSLRFKEKK